MANTVTLLAMNPPVSWEAPPMVLFADESLQAGGAK
jgi:hypothetical protein